MVDIKNRDVTFGIIRLNCAAGIPAALFDSDADSPDRLDSKSEGL